jgi:hypothetical protein
MTTTLRRIKIRFWKIVGILYDLRPRLHLPKYGDYPIASCDISDKYEYPENIKILFEWDEKGKHWIVFTR